LPDTVPAANVADALTSLGTSTVFPSGPRYSASPQSVPSSSGTAADADAEADAADACGEPDWPPVVVHATSANAASRDVALTKALREGRFDTSGFPLMTSDRLADIGSYQVTGAMVIASAHLRRWRGIRPRGENARHGIAYWRSVSTEPQPWQDAGWFTEMSGWIDARLANIGLRRQGEAVVVRAWARGVTITFETDRGRMWAKAVPEIFAHEVAVTELLFDIDPGVVPPVVAADRGLGRIITEHVDGPSLASLGDDATVWAATLSRLSELQRVLAADPGALAVAGVAAAPLERLAEDAPDLLTDDALLQVGRAGGLTTREAATIRARIPELVDTCHALAASGVPDSLEHGDLAADEVIIGEMGPVFLDWSDGSITHPFLSAASLMAGGADPVDDQDARTAAYLGPWLAAGIGLTAEAGHAAIASARTVLPLHLTSLFASRVLPRVGTDADLAGVVPRALRTLLPR
jgi:hypothetical protein